MTVRQVIALLVIACLTALVATFLTRPVRAQDIPPCVDADAFVSSLLKDDSAGREGPFVEYESHHADKLRLVEFKGVLWALLTNKGCLVVKPIPLDYIKDRGEPT